MSFFFVVTSARSNFGLRLLRIPPNLCSRLAAHTQFKHFFAIRGFAAARLLKSLALAYMRYPHGLGSLIITDLQSAMQKNAEKFAYVRFL